MKFNYKIHTLHTEASTIEVEYYIDNTFSISLNVRFDVYDDISKIRDIIIENAPLDILARNHYKILYPEKCQQLYSDISNLIGVESSYSTPQPTPIEHLP